MRLVIATMLLFSCLVLAKERDPTTDIEVIILEIPPAGGITSTAGTDVVTIKGLPDTAETIKLPQGWEAEAAPGGGMILLQGPVVADSITIQFTSPDPHWEAYIAGFSGMDSLWDAGLLTRDSGGVSTMSMKADDVVNSSAARCFRAKKRANSLRPSPADKENIKGERARASDVLGNWVSAPALGQGGIIQSSYTFQEDGIFSLKLDMISFCDGCNRGIDCDYFWIIHEGSYTDHDGVFTINRENEKRVLLLNGQTEPEITENSEYPHSYNLLVEIQGDKLLIRKSAGDEASVLKREY